MHTNYAWPSRDEQTLSSKVKNIEQNNGQLKKIDSQFLDTLADQTQTMLENYIPLRLFVSTEIVMKHWNILESLPYKNRYEFSSYWMTELYA